MPTCPHKNTSSDGCAGVYAGHVYTRLHAGGRRSALCRLETYCYDHSGAQYTTLWVAACKRR
eukprot:4318993-Karenia_brevis.AAC.1